MGNQSANLRRNLVAHHQSPEPGDGKALVVRLASACLQLQLCVPRGMVGWIWERGNWMKYDEVRPYLERELHNIYAVLI